MNRAFVACVGLAIPLLAACAGAPTPIARIVEFTASDERVPRNVPVTLLWQVADAGVQDGEFSCVLTRSFGDDPTETQVQAACSGGLTEVPPAPVTATAVHYRLRVLKQPSNTSDPYLTDTRTVILDAARYATRAGGTGIDAGQGVSVLRDGSAIVTGSFEGTASFGAHTVTSFGGSDVFIARVDANGNWTWAKRAGGTGGDTASGSSAHSWGGAVITGSFQGTAVFGGHNLTSTGDSDVFVAATDHNGNWVWAKRAGGTGADSGSGVSVLADGGAIVTGSFTGTATFGTHTLTSTGSDDVFVARIDPQGNWLWAKRGGGTGLDRASGVSTLPDGSAIVSGRFGNTATFGVHALTSAGLDDAFVARIDPDGTWTWATRAGGTGIDEARAISAFGDGGAIVTGSFQGTVAFGTHALTSAGLDDAFVARIDPDGTWTWASSAGGTNADRSNGVSTLPDGGAIVTGSFQGTVGFGTPTLTSAGSDDAFVARVTASGAW